MAADIIEARHEIDELSEAISLDHRVYFDPREFIAQHAAPTKEEFELSEDELQQWGQRCSTIRANFEESSINLNKERAGSVEA